MPTTQVDAGFVEPNPTGGTDAGTVGSEGIDPTLSQELANEDLVPTTLDDGIQLSEELHALDDNVQEPAFKIATPNGTFWLLARSAAIVSAHDTAAEGSGDWIGRSSLAMTRGLPSLGGCCEVGTPEGLGLPEMITVEDEGSRRNERVRLISQSHDGAWRLRWDFLLTHVTLRVERAPEPFGFTYRGAPGGTLDTADPGDRMVTPTGAIYGTSVGMNEDLLPYEPTGSLAGYWNGPAEWVYFFDVVSRYSLFLVQHADDSVTDRYEVLGDTAVMRFGSQTGAQQASSFSFGFVSTNVHQLVVEQVERAVAIDP